MWRFTLAVSSFFAGSALAVAQCSLCRSAVESGDPAFAEALRSGILLLLVMPYLLGLCVGAVVWRWRRRQRTSVIRRPSQRSRVLEAV